MKRVEIQPGVVLNNLLVGKPFDVQSIAFFFEQSQITRRHRHVKRQRVDVEAQHTLGKAPRPQRVVAVRLAKKYDRLHGSLARRTGQQYGDRWLGRGKLCSATGARTFSA